MGKTWKGRRDTDRFKHYFQFGCLFSVQRNSRFPELKKLLIHLTLDIKLT